jgi:hypothetical protein
VPKQRHMLSNGVGDSLCIRKLFARRLRLFVPAWVVGITSIDGEPVDPCTMISPCLGVLGMGWSWALFFTQNILEEAGRRAGLAEVDRVVDRGIPRPLCEPGEIRHASYVDNFLCIGLTDSVAVAAGDAWDAQLQKSGLPTHETSQGSSIDFVGLAFSGSANTIRVSAQRGWRLRLAISELLRRRRCHHSTLERIAGHYAWLAMINRPALRVFHQLYQHTHRSRGTASILPIGVRRELQQAMGLIPLLVCHMSASWSGTLYASDSSDFGFSVLRQSVGPEVSGGIGRQHERWRFALEDGTQDRLSALSAAARSCSDSELHEKAMDGLQRLVKNSAQHDNLDMKSVLQGGGETSFPEVDSNLFSEHLWTPVFHDRWRR